MLHVSTLSAPVLGLPDGGAHGLPLQEGLEHSPRLRRQTFAHVSQHRLSWEETKL